MSLLQDPEEARRAIAEMRESAQNRAESARRAVSRMTQLTAEAWSPRREVRVQVDAAGLVTDVEFAEWAPGESALSLARAVQQAHDRALRRWEVAMTAIADEEYADDPALRESTVRAAREALPERIQGVGDDEEDGVPPTDAPGDDGGRAPGSAW